MQEIQQATASEPLTLDEEYSMQKSWREDGDKLTFIVCLPLTKSSSSEKNMVVPEETDAPERMVGDVNLFLRFDDDDDNSVVGELELMVAEKQNQGKGFGRAALLAFLGYILARQDGIVDEFLQAEKKHVPNSKKEISYFSVKIGQTNTRSIALFESLGFTKVTLEPNYFGELELRRADLDAANLEQMLDRFAVTGYQELEYSSSTE
jgi:DNA polymerase delta subunit 2